jgi:hypothetical protein
MVDGIGMCGSCRVTVNGEVKFACVDGPEFDAHQINWVEFDKLCAIQCTIREIATWFNCHPDSINAACQREHGVSFPEYFEEKRGIGKVALRRKMYDVAMSGDKTMLIWLSKQWLGMSEKAETQTTVTTKPSQEELDGWLNKLKEVGVK